MNDNIVIVTGGFDPIHSGHIAYINAARTHGRVIVGVNSDAWLTRKKGSAFMPMADRKAIVQNLKDVMSVVEFDDSDNTAVDAIRKVRALFPKNKIVFANGGDRTSTNIPEMEAFKDDPSVEFIFGVGGDTKLNSSSTILDKWKTEQVDRGWGYFQTFFKNADSTVKLKSLVLSPKQSISMQYHNQRSELWFIEAGQGEVNTVIDGKNTTIASVKRADVYTVGCKEVHQLHNTSVTEDLIVVEIQHGAYCDESDIVRL
jgi:cytidyltransferase-like protein